MRRVEEDRLTSLNLSSSSVKATMIARERATACLTLSALSSISICFSMESTREPRSSALGGEEGGGEEGEGGGRKRRKEEEEEGGGGGGRGRREEEEGGPTSFSLTPLPFLFQLKMTFSSLFLYK